MRRTRSNPPSRDPGIHRRVHLDDRPRHPTAQAAVLLVVVTALIVGLAALSAWGLL